MFKFEYIVSGWRIHVSTAVSTPASEIQLNITPLSLVKPMYNGSFKDASNFIDNTQLLKYINNCVSKSKEVLLLNKRD